MTFRPNMTSQIEGISLCDTLSWRGWDGVVADVWHARGAKGAGGTYLSPDPRIVVLLEGAEALALSPVAGRGFRPVGRVFYVPAGMRVWSRVDHSHSFRHLDLHLDRARMEERLGGAIAGECWSRPILQGGSAALVTLAGLIARECTEPERHDLAGEGLIQAFLAELFALPPAAAAKGGLTRRQLARVREHVEANLGGRIAITDLAQVAGLSESWFTRAFKQATGLPPHQWVLRRRLARAQGLLEASDLPLAEIACAVGFADQAHLTRSFRSAIGITPGNWRRERDTARRGRIRQIPTETIKTDGALPPR